MVAKGEAGGESKRKSMKIVNILHNERVSIDLIEIKVFPMGFNKRVIKKDTLK